MTFSGKLTLHKKMADSNWYRLLFRKALFKCLNLEIFFNAIPFPVMQF